MLQAAALVKEFVQPGGAALRAVDGLSFEVAPGEIYGLLGPNGAGKTTAMRMLAALLRPTSGTAIVAGYSVVDEPDAVRARIGILTEVPGLYARLTPTEYLDFFAQVHGLTEPRRRAARVEEMLRLVGLWDRRRSVMRTFSKGMQQRVAIARTLLQDPPVLLLDEPTAALDPEAARGVRDYVRDLVQSRQRTVLLCTHNLFEAEQLCHRLSIVRGGRQLAEGTPSALRGAHQSTCLLTVRERTPELLERLHALPEIDSVKVEGEDAISYTARSGTLANPAVIRAAVAAGADVIGLTETALSLEDVYLQIISGSVPVVSSTVRGAPPNTVAKASRGRLEQAWLVAARELREMVRDPNLVLPLVVMPTLIGLLAGVSAFASFGPSTGAVGAAVTNAALDRLPEAAVQHLSNLPTTNRDATLETLLKAFSIPLFWVIPVALTPAVAADSFVGERERFSLEPLLATPLATTQVLLGKLAAAVLPAVLGTVLGVLVLWMMTLLSGSALYPRVLIGDPDWLFSLLVVTPLIALFTAGVAALLSTRVSGYRVAYQLNGLIALPIVLILIPATAFGFLLTSNALGQVALLFAVLDLGIVLWADRLFDRERLLSRR